MEWNILPTSAKGTEAVSRPPPTPNSAAAGCHITCCVSRQPFSENWSGFLSPLAADYSPGPTEDVVLGCEVQFVLQYLWKNISNDHKPQMENKYIIP